MDNPVDYLPALVLDLPLPPSVNRVTARLGNSSTIVKTWIRQADFHVLLQKQRILDWHTAGAFALHVTWSEDSSGDIDNRIKILLDYLQRIELVENDRHCRHLTVCYGDAPEGCRVRLSRPW